MLGAPAAINGMNKLELNSDSDAMAIDDIMRERERQTELK